MSHRHRRRARLAIYAALSACGCAEHTDGAFEADAGTQSRVPAQTTSSHGATTAPPATPSHVEPPAASSADSPSGPTTPSSTTEQPTSGPAPPPASSPSLPSVGGCSVFPADNPWNTDISRLPVHASSDSYIESVGRDTALHPDFGTEWQGAPIGIPYLIVDSAQPTLPITYTAYGDESDPGPMPFPLNAPIEGGDSSDGDRHALVIDRSSCKLYELYRAFPTAEGFEAESGTVWDLTRNEHHPEGCTSADAAGLPIFPGLVRYEEVVVEGEVRHALRFTVARTQRAYVFPARHYASNATERELPPMGLRFRMKANYDCSGYSDEVRVLCRAMKRYGLIVADNGSNWYVSGAPDPRWDDDRLRDLKQITGGAFEVVDSGETIVTRAPDCQTPK